MAGIKQRKADIKRVLSAKEKKELRTQDFIVAGFKGDAIAQNKFLIEKAAERKRERELEEMRTKKAKEK